MDEGDHAKRWRDKFDALSLERHQRDAASAGAPLEVDGRRLCLDCWVEIPAERLGAAPHAVRCAECQTCVERTMRK